MRKLLAMALVFALTSVVSTQVVLREPVKAGEIDIAAPQDLDRPDRLLNRNNLTATGETVPHPGEPQSAGSTALDRHIERRDNQIENSICSNCQ